MGFSIYSLLQTGCEEVIETSESNLVIKLPFALPYTTDWQTTENTGEEFLHKDRFYNIVSQKLANDTLYLECQFEESARDRFWEIVSNFDDHVNASNDSRNQTRGFIKHLLKEYMSIDRRLFFHIFEWVIPQTYAFAEASLLSQNIKDTPSPPPNFL